MRVQTDQLHTGKVGGRADGRRDLGRGSSELRPVVSGGYRVMGLDFDAGHHPQQSTLRQPLSVGHLAQSGEFVQAVGDDQTQANTHCQFKLFIRLVVAVQHYPCGRGAGPKTCFDLPAGSGQEIQSGIDHDADHAMRRERLDGIERLGEERGDHSAARSEFVFIHHEERGAVPLGQDFRRQTSDHQSLRAEDRLLGPRGSGTANDPVDVLGAGRSARCRLEVIHRRVPSMRAPRHR